MYFMLTILFLISWGFFSPPMSLWLMVSISKQKVLFQISWPLLNSKLLKDRMVLKVCLRGHDSRKHVDVFILQPGLKRTVKSLWNSLSQAASTDSQLLPHILCFTISQNVNRPWFIHKLHYSFYLWPGGNWEAESRLCQTSSCRDALTSAGRCGSFRRMDHRCCRPTLLGLGGHGGQPLRKRSSLGASQDPPGCLQTGLPKGVTIRTLEHKSE